MGYREPNSPMVSATHKAMMAPRTYAQKAPLPAITRMCWLTHLGARSCKAPEFV